MHGIGVGMHWLKPFPISAPVTLINDDVGEIVRREMSREKGFINVIAFEFEALIGGNDDFGIFKGFVLPYDSYIAGKHLGKVSKSLARKGGSVTEEEYFLGVI
jgi:hypothetical protein